MQMKIACRDFVESSAELELLIDKTRMTKGEVKSREDAVEQGRAVESINANASQLWRAA